MARITIDDIKKDTEKVSWKVLDSDYKNLQTPMTFICDKGHVIKEPWGKVRGRFQCDLCIKERKSKIVDRKVPEKTIGKKRILALDQASRTTGYSIFDGQELVAFGVYNASGSNGKARINDVCDWLEHMIELYEPDFVGIEDIQYNNGAHNTFKLLGQLMGAIFRTLYDAKIPHDSVLIPTWRKSVGVKGRGRAEQKANAQRVVKAKYGLDVSEDEADAICIGMHFAGSGKRTSSGTGRRLI